MWDRVSIVLSLSIGIFSAGSIGMMVRDAVAAPSAPIVWQYETVSPSSSPLLRPKSALILDRQGLPHIIFQRNREPFQSEGDIFHAFRTDGTWGIEHVESCYQCDLRPSAAFDSSESLHIAYFENGTLRYGVRTDSGWQLEQIPTPGRSVGDVNLAVGDDSELHIVFNSGPIGYYVTRDANTWNIERIATFFSPFSLALSPNGEPVVAGGNSETLSVATRGLSGWELESVGRGGFEASMALDDNGTPHIGHAVINDDDLRYATKSDSGWTNTIVRNLGPGAAGPSLALGPDGLPRMTFEIHLGDPGGIDDQMMYARYDGSQWTISVVDPRLSTESRTSLAVGDDGIAHVAYSLQNGNLIYAHTGQVPEPSCGLLALISIIVPALSSKRGRTNMPHHPNIG
jgi:hypothetical protein